MLHKTMIAETGTEISDRAKMTDSCFWLQLLPQCIPFSHLKDYFS